MIGLITLIAFIIGLKSTTMPIGNLTLDQSKIQIGQTMAFIVLALSELVHVFNIRDNKKSLFKGKVFNNKVLLGAIALSAIFMFIILFVPVLRTIFSIPALPVNNIIEVVILVLSPVVIVEIFKLLKINGKD